MKYFISLLFGALLHQAVFAQCSAPVITASGSTSICPGGNVTLSAPAGNTWMQKADFGGSQRAFAVGFTIGNKGYIGTGTIDLASLKKDFWEYDPFTNAWTQKADFGGTGRWGSVGFSIGSKGYIGTGVSNIGHTSDFWEYNPATNTWIRKADFGGGTGYGATGFSINSKGYVGTGYVNESNFTKAFWEYDPSSNVWTRKADFGGTARWSAVGFSIGTKGYMGTGLNDSYYRDFWEYNPSTNTWIQKADYGGLERSAASGFSIGNKGYIGLGYNGNFKKDFWEYNPSTNIWTQKTDFGGEARYEAASFSIGSKGYIGTGYITHSTGTDNFWEYDPSSTYSWSPGGQTTVSVTVNAAGSYSVTATNAIGCSATSAATTVTVKPATQITTQPQSVTTCKGSAATLSVTANGTNLSYKWYKNGQFSPYSNGAATLTINNAQVSDTGSYTVDVIGDCGTVTSTAVIVKVLDNDNGTIYVDNSVTASGSGYSWATAYKELREALNAASSCYNITTIQVAKGTYKPANTRDSAFTILRGGLKMYGGYPTGGGTRNVTANPTILSGDIGAAGNNTDNSYHVLVIAGLTSGADSLVLDGFTITGGNANGATSINYGSTSVYPGNGGGAYIINNANGKKIVLRNLTVSNNRADYVAGGFEINNSSPFIVNCIFNNNSSGNNGGGMFNEVSASPSIVNCLFVSNSSNSNGGGLSNLSSSPSITNCTFYANSSSNGGGAIYNSSSSPLLNSCIIWGNTGSNPGIYGSGGTVKYSNVQGLSGGTGNLNTNPFFANPSDADGTDNIWGTSDDGLKLQSGSPSINTGSNADVPSGITTDITDNARILNGTVDMGAYETFLCPPSHKLYVNGGQATSGNGSSWATAIKELREALQMAQYCGNVDSILVAAGTYKPTDNTDQDSAFAILRGGIKIYGGYNAATGARNISANPTLLSGDIGTAGNTSDNSYHVLVIAGLAGSADSVVLDGLTIRDGFAPTATGSKNYNGISVPRTMGAGICLQSNNGAGRKIMIRNCSILANLGHTNGGISNESSSPAIISCTFSGNYGYNGGGGGIGNYNASSPLVVNCIFTLNNSAHGGGMSNLSSSPVVTNCTFVYNSGDISNYNSSPVITNCILWNSSYNTNVSNDNTSNPVITYSIVQVSTGVYPGTGNLNGDPLFTGNYQIRPGSPAINAGSNAAVPSFVTTDISGAVRIQNGVVDMGAYETGFTCPTSHKLYVNGSVAASGNGASWATAYKELREAMQNLQFCTDVDSIVVAAGTYNPSINNADSSFAISRGGLKIYGGYNAATGVRNISANPTILSGDIGAAGGSDNSYHVLVIVGLPGSADSVVLDGFTITQGYATGTGSKNYFGTDVPRNAGGGICLYANNGAGGKIAIRNCIITKNTAQSGGGGLYNLSSSPTILNCLFTSNTGTNGTAMFNSNAAQPKIVNCVFNQNTAGYGAIYNLACTPVVTNCTFNYNYYGVYNNNASPFINNSILWNNTNGTNGSIPGIFNEGSSTPVVTNSIVQGGDNGTGGLNIDPLFVNSGDADGADNIFATADDGLKLQAGSPAINAGSNAAAAGIPTDITGSIRIQNNIVDMGAYEQFTCPASPVLYVDNSANGNGSSWVNALSGLSEALNIAAKCSSITTIYVAKGTYKPTTDTNRDSAFTILRGGLKIYGGYPTGGGTRNPTANPTILSGDIGTANTSSDNSYHVMVIAGLTSSADSLVIDGFNTTSANANGGGGKTYAGITTYQNEGGGIYLHSNNGAGGKIAIRNCTFSNNSVTEWGGGIYNQLSSPTIINCAFTANTARNAAGIFNYNSSSPAITNCVFTANIALQDGGAINNRLSSSPVITNCTLFSNGASASGAGIYNNGSSPFISNTVIWGNTGNFPGIYVDNSSPTVTYSDVQGGYPGTGNITIDPLFVNPADADGADNIFGTADDGLALRLGSPAVNTGSNAAVPAGITTDIAGAARIQNSMVDMGAYESPYITYSIATAVSATSVCTGATIPVTYTAVGTYNSGYTFTAQLSDASGSFANPITIGSVTATASGVINATIPSGTAAGIGYRIRVVSSTPPITGSDNGSNITINVTPATPTVSVIQPTCTIATGTITVNTPTGTGIIYSINGSVYQAGNIFNNVGPGSYSVTDRNSSGCVSSAAPVTINAVPATPATPTVSIIQPSCSVATGTITVNSPGGAGIIFSIDGTNYQSANTFNNITPGNYYVTAKNSSGCVSSAASVTINTAPSSLATPTVSTTQPTCTAPTGTITVNSPTGAGITYSINGTTYQASNMFSNIAPGNYNVTAKNSSGCVSATPVTINTVPADNQPPSIPSNLTVFLNANGQGSLTPANVAPLITDNCAVNPNSITVSANSFTCFNANAIVAHQAYMSYTSTGNANYDGQFGMSFKVNNANGIMIDKLGAFDDGGNGITGNQNGGVRVAIFNVNTQAIVPGLDVTIAGTADPLVSGSYRMRSITPVTLAPGNYVIITKGYVGEKFYNRNQAGALNPVGDNAAGVLTFLNTVYYGNAAAFGFPNQVADAANPNEYIAGTFNYLLSANNTVTVSAADMSGNMSTVTASVTIVDTLYVLTAKNATVTLDANRQATIVPADVLQSLKNNCGVDVTTSTLQVSPSTFGCSDITSGLTLSTTPHQAYVSNTIIGNSNYDGQFGMTFRVNDTSGIVIDKLGAFDDGGNGITGSQSGGVRVVIFNVTTQTIVPGLDVTIAGTTDPLAGSYRMHSITPVTLPAGNYVIVTKGYVGEKFYNRQLSGPLNPAGDSAAGTLTFLNTVYYGNIATFGFPNNAANAGNPNEYIAGTFNYKTFVTATGVTVTLTATDVYGHQKQATAQVVVKKVIGPTVITKNITLNLDASGHASIVPNDVLQTPVTDNCGLQSVTVSPNSFACSDYSAGGGNGSPHQAYVSNTSTGNFNYDGQFGMTFRVNNANGIVIDKLGAFDDQGNGITGNQGGGIRVAIFNVTTQAIVPGLDVTIAGSTDPLVGSYRMRSIAPVMLPAGNYVIITKGYVGEKFYNRSQAGALNPAGDNAAGVLTFSDTVYYGNAAAFGFPNNVANAGNPNEYIAGTFNYALNGNNNKTVTVTATDIHGNVTNATAIVTLTNTSNSCGTPAPVMAYATKSAQTEVPVVVDNITMSIKVYPNPSSGQFTVQLSNLKASKVSLQIMDGNGQVVLQQQATPSSKTPVLSIPVDISKQASGVYLIRVISADGVQTAKVVVSR